MNVYAIGALKIDFNAKREVSDSRLWGIYSSFKKAEKAILEDHGVFEEYYNYALIEQIHVIGTKAKNAPFISPQWWYYAEHPVDENTKIKVIPIEIPEQFKNICMWWVG